MDTETKRKNTLLCLVVAQNGNLHTVLILHCITGPCTIYQFQVNTKAGIRRRATRQVT